MNTSKADKSNKYMLLFFIVIYTFVTISHIFYLPHYNTDNSKNIFISKEHHDSAHLHRVDKSTIDEKKKSVADVINLATIVLLFICIGTALLSLKSPIVAPNYLLINRQYSYLSFCTFRI